ncbi:hypothetical protein PS6_010418 [Mucor atramentarius]
MSLPPLVFFSLTPEDDNDDLYPTSPQDYENEECTWIDDSECQENLFQIISLTPEETIIDKDNHIQTSFKLFFEELGYLTEEPEPIDPNRDYEQEAKDLLNQRDRKILQGLGYRRLHRRFTMSTTSLISDHPIIWVNRTIQIPAKTPTCHITMEITIITLITIIFIIINKDQVDYINPSSLSLSFIY